MSGKTGYIHGFSQKEQDRLWHQANMQRDQIYGLVDFSSSSKILEIGCGVGAQTRILCEENPHLKIYSVDTSEEQIETAKINLKSQIEAGQVELHKIEPGPFPFEKNFFDGVFICWVLEHVPQPLEILKNSRTVLKKGSPIFCNEVLNNTLYVNPYSPCITKYWFEFNDHQWSLGGDPFIGARLGNLLQRAGFENIDTKVLSHHLDNRSPKKREKFIDYWCDLLVSGSPGLIDSLRVDKKLVESMKQEMQSLKDEEDSVLFYSWVFAQAYS